MQVQTNKVGGSMENQQTFKTPIKTLARMQVVHLGKVLFNLQFIAVVIMIASVISFILPAIYYLLLICIAMLSLFALFAEPGFRALWAGGETLTQIANVLKNSWNYTITIVAVFSVVSIVCLCFDKYKKQLPRIIISAVVFVIDMLILIFKLANSGVFA